MIISVSPLRLLKTQAFEEKRLISQENFFWPIFSRISEYNKPQGTICKCPRGIVTVTVEVTRSFL